MIKKCTSMMETLASHNSTEYSWVLLTTLNFIIRWLTQIGVTVQTQGHTSLTSTTGMQLAFGADLRCCALKSTPALLEPGHYPLGKHQDAGSSWHSCGLRLPFAPYLVFLMLCEVPQYFPSPSLCSLMQAFFSKNKLAILVPSCHLLLRGPH